MAANSYEDVLRDATSQKSKKNIIFQFSKTYPAWLILIIAIGLSIGLIFFVESSIKGDNELAFEKATNSVITRIKDKYTLNDQILNSINAIFSSYVVRDVFELNAATPANTYPSIRSILRIQKVPNDRLEDFIYNTRSQGYYDMQINPDNENETHYLTEYVVPFERNPHLSGYDFSSDPMATKYIEQAGKNNLKVITPVYNTRKDTIGFYLIAPQYQVGMPIETEEDRMNNFMGALIIEISPSIFYENALGKGVSSDSNIVFDIYEEIDGAKNTIFKSFNIDILKQNYNPIVTEIKDFKINQKSIFIDFKTVPDFGGEFQKYLPLISLIAGILVSFILFGFILSVITSRQRALELADQMTKSQRRIVESSQDIIAVLDFNGIWKTMNRAAEDIFNVSAEEMVGMSVDELFIEKQDSHKFYSIIESSMDDYTERLDFQMKARGNKVKWVNWSLTVSQTDKLIYAIGRDITLEKEAQTQQDIRNKQVQLAEQFSREASESKSFFMTQLSHQLRNSLTGILGYLDLVQNGFYDNEEEMKEYVKLAEMSSEEIFQFVSDIVDITIATDGENTLDMSTVSFKDVFDKVNYKSSLTGELEDIKIELVEENGSAHFIGDKNVMNETLLFMYKALAEGNNSTTTIQVNASDNPYEGAMEIQMLGSENSKLEKMIHIYKAEKDNIIDALENDEDDILLKLSIIESNIRRLNGSFSVETFGGEEGNIFMVTLPMNQNLKKK